MPNNENKTVYHAIGTYYSEFKIERETPQCFFLVKTYPETKGFPIKCRQLKKDMDQYFRFSGGGYTFDAMLCYGWLLNEITDVRTHFEHSETRFNKAVERINDATQK